MTYWWLNLAFLGTVALVALAAWLARRMPSWRLVGLTAIPVVLLTAVFDNLIVGTHIVSYHAAQISGVFVGVAPLEDFSYAIAVVVLLPCLWTLLTPRSSVTSDPPSAAPLPTAEPPSAARSRERAPISRGVGEKSRRSRAEAVADPREPAT